MDVDLTIGNAIRSLKFADDLAEALVDKLADVSAIYQFAEHETVFREGQTHSKIFWVHSGRIRLEMTLPGQSPRSLLTVSAGEVLAWSAFNSSQPMTATGSAAIDSVLVGFDVDRLRSLCESNHEIGYRFTDCLCIGLAQRLVATRLQLLDLFTNPSELS